MEHHARKVGLRDTGDTASTGGGSNQGVGKFLQGSGAGDSIVRVRDVGPFGVNGKEGRGTGTVTAVLSVRDAHAGGETI